jgi:dTDP-4-amino-4,6-dideoxygalactose transaminase
VFGNTTDTQKYADWAKTHGKFLLFDNAATAFSTMTTTNNNTTTTTTTTNINNVGHAATLSFHHTKPLGFGEGGAIILDKALVPYIRRVINFGIDNQDPNATWHRVGSNYKMSDIAAAYILQYLDNGNLEAIRAHHQRLYAHALTCLPPSVRLFPTKDPRPFVACLALLMDPKQSLEAQRKFQVAGIFSRKYYQPLAPLPCATALFDRILCVPLHRDMSEEDVEHMLGILGSAVSTA